MPHHSMYEVACHARPFTAHPRGALHSWLRPFPSARNQELAAALGGGARQLQESTQVAGAAQISVARLEAELARARQQGEAAAKAEKTARANLASAREEAAAASKECDEAQAARIAAERSCSALKRQCEEQQVRGLAGRVGRG
jgi:chromosome segregation ATPase